MNYKQLFLKLKTNKLRYISSGWTGIQPYAAFYEIPSQLTKLKGQNEANLVFEFGDQLETLICLTCKCVDYKDGTIYRFMLTEIESRELLENVKTSFNMAGLTIQSVDVFEPIAGVYSIPEDDSLDGIDEEQYFGNGLLLTFSNGTQLELYGTEGYNQHEPIIYLHFINPNDSIEYDVERNKNWRLKQKV